MNNTYEGLSKHVNRILKQLASSLCLQMLRATFFSASVSIVSLKAVLTILCLAFLNVQSNSSESVLDGSGNLPSLELVDAQSASGREWECVVASLPPDCFTPSLSQFRYHTVPQPMLRIGKLLEPNPIPFV